MPTLLLRLVRACRDRGRPEGDVKQVQPAASRPPARASWWTGGEVAPHKHGEKAIVGFPGEYVHVDVRYLLERCRSVRRPHAHPLRRKVAAYHARDADNCGHERGCHLRLQLVDLLDVLLGNDKCVYSFRPDWLAKVHEGDCSLVLSDHACVHIVADDSAEQARAHVAPASRNGFASSGSRYLVPGKVIRRRGVARAARAQAARPCRACRGRTCWQIRRGSAVHRSGHRRSG